MGKARSSSSPSSAIGYEARLRQMVDARRSNVDAAEYGHALLGLIFHKDISDTCQHHHARLVPERTAGDDPEDPDEYRALTILWVPPEVCRAHLRAQSSRPTSGQLVEDGLDLNTNLVLANPPLRVSDWGGEYLSSDKGARGVSPTGEGLRQKRAAAGGLIT